MRENVSGHLGGCWPEQLKGWTWQRGGKTLPEAPF